MTLRALLALALLAAPVVAAAQAPMTPPASAAPKPDRRVLTLPYAADQVYELPGHYTPNRRADTLFLKPIERGATTNLSVVTNKRRYAFVLTAREPMGPDDPSLVFRVRFAFPEASGPAADAALPEPEVRNSG